VTAACFPGLILSAAWLMLFRGSEPQKGVSRDGHD
jgi:hypothetical protein